MIVKMQRNLIFGSPALICTSHRVEANGWTQANSVTVHPVSIASRVAGGMPRISILLGFDTAHQFARQLPADTAYIELAYALRGDKDDTHFVTCCSQVFDLDGGGMQFVAFEARDPVADVAEARRNPFLSRDDMPAVLARSLELYQRRNGGDLPKRMVIHKTTAFKNCEIDGAFDALAGVPEIECIEVSAASCWRGVWLIKSGQAKSPRQPSGYPVPRGNDGGAIRQLGTRLGGGQCS
jgi:hypothetical protein